MRFPCCLVILLGALWLTGCGDKTNSGTRAPVKGTVKLDGQLLQTGHVTFDAQNGEPPAVMNILDGSYEGMAAVGKNKVSITSVKKMTVKEFYATLPDGPKDGPGYDQMMEVNALPPRYNDKSEIVREVTPDGPNEFNFDLKSK